MVSIITPLYNSEKFVKDTIDCVLSQTFDKWELIIIDDYSSDNTYQIAKNYAETDERIRVYQNTGNKGAAITRNRAVELAEEKYIAYLDGDDFWLPQKLEIQIGLMESKDLQFTHSSYMLIDEDGKSLKKKSIAPGRVTYKDLIKFNWIGTSTVIYNAEILGKQYMPDIRNRQDWACWLRLAKLTDAHFIDMPLVKYRIRENSISSDKVKLIKYHWKIYREIEEFSWLKSIIYLSQNLLTHIRSPKIVELDNN